jgi:arsenate reductase (thioredoxin)
MSSSFREYNVLFVCAHNSTRSLMAECALRRWGNGRFNAYSAGREPAETPNPMALRTLQTLNFKTDALRPKSWNAFLADDAPRMDFVFVVGGPEDEAGLPSFPGAPMVAAWPVDDPLDVVGPEDKQLRAFRATYLEIESRCKIFASLRVEGLDNLTLQSSLNLIGTHHRPAGNDAQA